MFLHGVGYPFQQLSISRPFVPQKGLVLGRRPGPTPGVRTRGPLSWKHILRLRIRVRAFLGRAPDPWGFIGDPGSVLCALWAVVDEIAEVSHGSVPYLAALGQDRPGLDGIDLGGNSIPRNRIDHPPGRSWLCWLAWNRRTSSASVKLGARLGHWPDFLWIIIVVMHFIGGRDRSLEGVDGWSATMLQVSQWHTRGRGPVNGRIWIGWRTHM